MSENQPLICSLSPQKYSCSPPRRAGSRAGNSPLTDGVHGFGQPLFRFSSSPKSRTLNCPSRDSKSISCACMDSLSPSDRHTRNSNFFSGDRLIACCPLFGRILEVKKSRMPTDSAYSLSCVQIKPRAAFFPSLFFSSRRCVPISTPFSCGNRVLCFSVSFWADKSSS